MRLEQFVAQLPAKFVNNCGKWPVPSGACRDGLSGEPLDATFDARARVPGTRGAADDQKEIRAKQALQRVASRAVPRLKSPSQSVDLLLQRHLLLP
jgi:hypothetical protein